VTQTIIEQSASITASSGSDTQLVLQQVPVGAMHYSNVEIAYRYFLVDSSTRINQGILPLDHGGSDPLAEEENNHSNDDHGTDTSHSNRIEFDDSPSSENGRNDTSENNAIDPENPLLIWKTIQVRPNEVVVAIMSL
jgi:hypothetical protein